MSFQCYMPVRVLGGEDAVARNAKLLAGLEPVEMENHLQELMVQTGFSREVP